MPDHKATLAGLVKTYGEEKIVGWVNAQLAQAERRRVYSKSPEAKVAATQRRDRARAELQEFRAYKAARAGKK